jgi:hypothetical protein
MTNKLENAVKAPKTRVDALLTPLHLNPKFSLAQLTAPLMIISLEHFIFIESIFFFSAVTFVVTAFFVAAFILARAFDLTFFLRLAKAAFFTAFHLASLVFFSFFHFSDNSSLTFL